MTSIDDCRELGLLPEEVVAYLSETSYWSRSQENDDALESLAAALLEQAKAYDDLDSWDGHLRWLDKWYPASIFGAPGDVPKNPLDTGCSNVILTRALAAEKARADEAESALTVTACAAMERDRDHFLDLLEAAYGSWVYDHPFVPELRTFPDWLADLARRSGGEA